MNGHARWSIHPNERTVFADQVVTIERVWWQDDRQLLLLRLGEPPGPTVHLTVRMEGQVLTEGDRTATRGFAPRTGSADTAAEHADASWEDQ